MIELIGILGSLSLALCGLPMLIKAVKEQHAKGVSSGFLILWLLGELLLVTYVLMTTADWILLLNYGFNVVLVTAIVYYKLK